MVHASWDETDAITLSYAASPIFQPQLTRFIRSPHHVNEMLLQAMPAGERVSEALRRFEPVDWRGYQVEPSDFGLKVAVMRLGNTRVSASAMRRGMEMTVVEPGAGSYTFCVRWGGSLRVAGCGARQDGAFAAGTGVLYREREGARIATSDMQAGLAFELRYDRVVAVLSGLIDAPVHGEVVFAPSFPLNGEPGASVARLVAYLERELAAKSSLLSGGSVAPAFEDLLIRSLLTVQRHSHSSLLERDPKGAAPYNVSRAEAFMRAHAHETPSIERIADAAGCGVRSLQTAFRRFRNRTPMEELKSIRLDRAHRELLAGGRTVTEIAMRWGFSSPSRFAQEYQRAFGRRPSKALQNFDKREPPSPGATELRDPYR